MNFEVESPILCSPFAEPDRHWFIPEGATPVQQAGRRPSFVFQPREGVLTWDLADGTLAPMQQYGSAYELVIVNRIRERVAEWRASGYENATGVTLDLLAHWRREGRAQPLFFAQIEAAETIIFLTEARADLRQGISVPLDQPTPEQLRAGAEAFRRYACKMATGSGKTTVMGMLAAWSILNKLVNKADARFSDLVLAVCPNVTIRDRLQELDVTRGEASLYRTRDLVPEAMMPRLAQGRVVITNWHAFEPRVQGVGDVRGGVLKVGSPKPRTEHVFIGDKNTRARNEWYMTEAEYLRQVASGEVDELEPPREVEGRVRALVRWMRYEESDTSIVQRVLGCARGKQNILVLNDEAHHAYRIRRDEADEGDDLESEADVDEAWQREATVWVEGLDRIHKLRGINACVDLSATPFFLGAVGRETGRPFPWTVSDFALTDAIESGLVKIPQLPLKDSAAEPRSVYHSLWKFVTDRMTPAERGGKRGSPKPEAVLKYAFHPLGIMIGDWEQTLRDWQASEEVRPPVFIVVCRDTKLAKVVYEWIAEGWSSYEVPPLNRAELANRDGRVVTVRVDSKVVEETDGGSTEGGGSQVDDARWMRFTLDTVGVQAWPLDAAGRPLYPPEFEEVAERRAKRLEVDVESLLAPPGRDVRCIVSVGMLTEGWDARTVTHVVGLRPFQSQLLCEQVVGRALRRASYEPRLAADGSVRFEEEVAQVLGVPFDIVPYKAVGAVPVKPSVRRHVRALPERAAFMLRFPRVDGYTQVVRNRVEVDWDRVPRISLHPEQIPPVVTTAAAMANNAGRIAAIALGGDRELSLQDFIRAKRMQEYVFEAAAALTKDYIATGAASAPAHVLFPQLQRIIQRYVDTKVDDAGVDRRILFAAPYYGWFLERLVQAMRTDVGEGAREAPRYERTRPEGSTADVSWWTSKEVRETVKSHVNYVVCDSKLEAQAAQKLDGSRYVRAWVKNAGLGLGVKYVHNGQPHDYIPDFIVRLEDDRAERYLLLETKGYDELVEVKKSAAERWCAAVTADGKYGSWQYRLAYKATDVAEILIELAGERAG